MMKTRTPGRVNEHSRHVFSTNCGGTMKMAVNGFPRACAKILARATQCFAGSAFCDHSGGAGFIQTPADAHNGESLRGKWFSPQPRQLRPYRFAGPIERRILSHDPSTEFLDRKR